MDVWHQNKDYVIFVFMPYNHYAAHRQVERKHLVKLNILFLGGRGRTLVLLDMFFFSS